MSEGNRGTQQPGVDWCQKETEEDNSQEWTGVRSRQGKTTAGVDWCQKQTEEDNSQEWIGARSRQGKTTARSGLVSSSVSF